MILFLYCAYICQHMYSIVVIKILILKFFRPCMQYQMPGVIFFLSHSLCRSYRKFPDWQVWMPSDHIHWCYCIIYQLNCVVFCHRCVLSACLSWNMRRYFDQQKNLIFKMKVFIIKLDFTRSVMSVWRHQFKYWPFCGTSRLVKNAGLRKPDLKRNHSNVQLPNTYC